MTEANNIKVLKDSIRKELLGRLRGQDPSSREKRSRRIQEKFVSSDRFGRSQTIMSYVSLYSEVDTGYLNQEILDKNKRLVVPFIDTDRHVIIASQLKSIDDLVRGPYGIYAPKEPLEVSLKEIDLVIVPAVAYDRNNMRLGRGKGYYDRFLSQDELSPVEAVGLAFDFQVMDCLPHDPHDIPVSRVITD